MLAGLYLDQVDLVPQHEGGQDDGDHGAGEDDAESVRDVHEADRGQGGDDCDGSSEAYGVFIREGKVSKYKNVTLLVFRNNFGHNRFFL